MTALSYRLAKASDLPLIIDSWCKSYRTSHSAGMISMADWRVVMERQVKRVLSRPGVQVWVAFHPGEAEGSADLYGWIAVEHEYMVPVRRTRRAGRHRERVSGMEPGGCPLVHYVYVLASYRKLGVARGLMRAAGVDPEAKFRYTCKTAAVAKLEEARKIPRAEHAPLIARHEKETA